jgi:hypothetical protein
MDTYRIMTLFGFTWALLVAIVVPAIVVHRFDMAMLEEHAVRLDMLMNFKQDKPRKEESSNIAWKAGRISGCESDEVPVLLGVSEGDPRYMQWLCAKSKTITPQMK